MWWPQRQGAPLEAGAGAVSCQDDRIAASALVCTTSAPGLLGVLPLLSPGTSLVLMNLNTSRLQRCADFQTQPEPLPAAVFL